MPYRLLPLLACTLALTSCIVTYRDFPQVDLQSVPVAPEQGVIYYHLIERPVYVGWVYYYLTYANLERLFARDETFSQANPDSVPPEEGLYYSVDARIGLTGISPGVFTPKVEIQPNLVMYSLYEDGELKRSYIYAFNRQVTWWLLAAPVSMWANLFTSSIDEPLRATFYQFLLEAERDGYLQQP